MNQFKNFIGVCVLFAFLPTVGFARDLHGRLGLGFNRQFSNESQPGAAPGIGLKYAFTRDLAVEGILGLATTKPTNSCVGMKFFKNIFFENNLNFYFMAAGAVVTANSQSGSDIQSGFGTEFFIPGLESVGFSLEVGGEFTNISGSFAFKTLGLSFLDAGMRFYF